VSENVLVIDDEKSICTVISHILKADGFDVTTATSGEEGVKLLESAPFDLVISDIMMDGIGGREVLKRALEIAPGVPVIMITAYGTIDSAVELVRMGATDYIAKPFVNEDLKLRVRKAMESKRLEKENVHLREELSRKYDFSKIVGTSDSMKQVFNLMDRAIPVNSNILITGDTGTGKGVVARAIHYNGPRKGRPFIGVNCGAIPENLLESQLFGHKKGAFTSANADARGLVEEAEGGTLFLDEIGEMPLAVQVKILKLIQDKEFIPVGGTKPVTVDARVISATNKDLDKLVAEEKFRSDLYYRLDVIEIHLPPLKDRGSDVLIMARKFIREFARESGAPEKSIAPEVEAVFMKYPWPGNIRELRNVIERAVVLCDGGGISPEHLPERFQHPGHGGKFSPHLKDAHEEFESSYIQRVLNENDGDKELVAKILGIDLATLYRKIKKYDLKS
jgi:DNA-binding NtrC family response regulator